MAPTSRYENLDEARRTALMDAAIAEFAAQGYDGAALARIAEGASLSKGVLYYYFEDKTDLYIEAVRTALAQAAEEIGMPRPEDFAGDFWGEVRGLLKRELRYGAERPQIVQLAATFFQLPSKAFSSPELHRFYEQGVAFTARILEAGRSQGAVRDDVPLELLARAIMAVGEAADSWVLLRWGEFADDLDATTELYLDLFRRICIPMDEKREEL